MKRWKVFIKRQAEEDANDIWFYIAQDNPRAAEAFLSAVEEASSTLSTTPEIGSLRYFYHPELQGLRFYPLKKLEKYLLFYRAVEEEEVVEIVRIVHGARDLPRLFGGEEN
ncbi:MAG: type II toxin-antitoxin system RelE/ParE family toxin [Methylococcales bacterium]